MRFAVSGDISLAPPQTVDFLIVGAGLCGLYAALHLPKDRSILVLTKERLDASNSWLAQGGIAASTGADDTPALHMEDTLTAGAGLCDHAAVNTLVSEAPDDIQNLISMQVPFDYANSGDLRLAREGGHSRRRVLHAGGDKTGKETVKALARLATAQAHISFSERAFLVDIITNAKGEVSAALIHANGAYRLVYTKHLLIATGGIGEVYASSTNPSAATGDGIAAAIRAGAKVQAMEFVQFHPTGLYEENHNGQAFLISEAVRGEGAVLRNQAGARFMEGKHPLCELAPRDVVARAIWQQMQEDQRPFVHLDIRHKSREYLAERFPTIFETCLRQGFDLSCDMIPVCPVQHYLIGGIQTDLSGRTNVKGLYAAGEAASTGVHGANRLAANSMLECIVFGRRAALAMQSDYTPTQETPNTQVDLPQIPMRTPTQLNHEQLRTQLQKLMSRAAFVSRTPASLALARTELAALFETLSAGFDNRRVCIELTNLVFIADAILTAASARAESVGAHYMEQNPD